MRDKFKSCTLLRITSDRVRLICEGLLGMVQIDASTVTKDSVVPLQGIYIWRFKADGRPAYIGVGLGKKGLQQRIVEQHLRASYNKSVFRKAIEKEACIGPSQESVRFIRSHFTLAVIPCPEDSPAIVDAAEALLIAAINPRYNKTKDNNRQYIKPDRAKNPSGI